MRNEPTIGNVTSHKKEYGVCLLETGGTGDLSHLPQVAFFDDASNR